jgi:hypothetical protein
MGKQDEILQRLRDPLGGVSPDRTTVALLVEFEIQHH